MTQVKDHLSLQERIPSIKELGIPDVKYTCYNTRQDRYRKASPTNQQKPKKHLKQKLTRSQLTTPARQE